MAFNSRVSYTGSTSTGPYSFSAISLFSDAIVPLQTSVVVTIAGVVQTYTSGTATAGEYSMNKTLSQITLGTAPTAVQVVKIQRVTSPTAIVDFTNNSPLTAADLDTATTQALYLSEESSDSLLAGDAVLALPELTDVYESMAPADGEFLRYNAATSKWIAQAYASSSSGTGTVVNVVTSFPLSPTAGDMIYHSVYGAAYIYDGASWQYMNGSGAKGANPVAGTTVAELTFETEGAADTLTLPSGWHALFPDGAVETAAIMGGLNGGGFSPYGYHQNASGNWTEHSDTPTHDFGKAWYATGLTNTSGTIGFSDATFDSECAAAFPDVYNNTWWGGTGESNSALTATAVLCPRMDTYANLNTLTGHVGTATSSWKSIALAYPAAINWSTQSWRVTSKFVTFQPGWNGANNQKFAAQWFMPTISPFLSQGATWNISDASDTGGSIAASNADKADFGKIISGALIPCLAPPSSQASADNQLVPIPGFIAEQDNHLTAAVFGSSSYMSPVHPTPGAYSPYLQAAAATETPSTSFTQEQLNGGSSSLADKAICYTVTTSWDAAAKVMTSAVVPDSSTVFNMGNGADVSVSLSTPAASGDYIATSLLSMSSDFWFTMGASSNYVTTASNMGEGLVSIKIETL